MDDSMVTGRMLATKKQEGARVLQQAGLNASQAINLMYDRLVEEGSAEFLLPNISFQLDDSKWAAAASFVDSLSSTRKSRFDEMSKAEIKQERLRAKNQA